MLDTFIVPAGAPDGLAAPPPKPEIHVIESTDSFGRVAVEPLQRGFGQTVGNPMRRILLSSTRGAAITWVRIADVVHEYMAIPGVKEEVMEILLNIKNIRIRASSSRMGKLRLEVKGPGPVCAGDIISDPGFEIVNPELHLATLDDEDAGLEIEFNVEQGTGYRPAQPGDNGPHTPTGALPVDALFSPVRKVNFDIEPTRVGQHTDYERLMLEVWTDGAIRPVEAVQQAADELYGLFFLFRNLNSSDDRATDRLPRIVSPEVYRTRIEDLQLSPRTLNCLKRANINWVGEVLDMSDEDLLKIRNFGEKSLFELQEKLSFRGIPDGRQDTPQPIPAPAVAAVAPAITIENLDELMGSDTRDASSLPAGMSFAENFDTPGDLDEDADADDSTAAGYEDPTDANPEDPAASDYEQD